MKNFIQPGSHLEVAAPRNLSSGDGFKVGDLFLVAIGSALQNAQVVGVRDGVHQLPKTTVAFAQGAKVYWDDVAGHCTNDATKMFIGYAAAAVLAAAASVNVILLSAIDGGAGTAGETLLHVSASHAQVTADTSDHLFVVPAGKTAKLVGASYFNATGLAEHASNYFAIKVQVADDAAPVVLAQHSTEEGDGDGSIAAGVAVELGLTDDAVAAGEAIELFLDETGTATLPAGRIATVWQIEDAAE
jgi:predicted RecA/RadA family phage recombinase